MRVPDGVAFVFGDRSWSDRELGEAVQDGAAELSPAGLGAGDRLAVLGRNSHRHVITWLATQLLGASPRDITARRSCPCTPSASCQSGCRGKLLGRELGQSVAEDVVGCRR